MADMRWVVLMAAGFGLFGLGGCADDDGDDAADTASTTTADTVVEDATTFTTVADEATTVSTGAEAPSTAEGEPEADGTDLADGRHPVYLTGLDVAARTIEVDVIQFLTGEEATAAYLEDNPGETEGPPNDYYIVNDNPRVRTLTVSPDVEVLLVRLEEDSDPATSPGTFEELPDYTAGWAADDGTLWYNPFWLTIEGGLVVGAEEQFVP